MKKLLKIKHCNDCPHLKIYKTISGSNGLVVCFENPKNPIVLCPDFTIFIPSKIEIPNSCPLENYEIINQ